MLAIYLSLSYWNILFLTQTNLPLFYLFWVAPQGVHHLRNPLLRELESCHAEGNGHSNQSKLKKI